ncbi:MAG: hypothetical protein CBB96_07700 [Gammaproteobacteria bacterium TMED36]|nr:MAG: hypothetical protein CBB96_07700 [Gammaproteobacteria bacterium TMED36]|tara:strand:- start:2518 stop:2817 length:300 start_codon:yes stop_codon:yes gene_type:complete
MPLDSSSFPEEIQLAFFIYGFLSDDWDGMSGTYMGKKWVEVDTLFKIYNVHDTRETLFWMKLYDGKVIEKRYEQSEQKRKAEERKSSGAGKNYTHNVKG